MTRVVFLDRRQVERSRFKRRRVEKRRCGWCPDLLGFGEPSQSVVRRVPWALPLGVMTLVPIIRSQHGLFGLGLSLDELPAPAFVRLIRIVRIPITGDV